MSYVFVGHTVYINRILILELYGFIGPTFYIRFFEVYELIGPYGICKHDLDFSNI